MNGVWLWRENNVCTYCKRHIAPKWEVLRHLMWSNKCIQRMLLRPCVSKSWPEQSGNISESNDYLFILYEWRKGNSVGLQYFMYFLFSIKWQSFDVTTIRRVDSPWISTSGNFAIPRHWSFHANFYIEHLCLISLPDPWPHMIAVVERSMTKARILDDLIKR